MSEQGRTYDIVAGLRGQNNPAKFEGQEGFWCQGDCVLIQAKTPIEAINIYREKISKAQVCIVHNEACGSIREAMGRIMLEKR